MLEDVPNNRIFHREVVSFVSFHVITKSYIRFYGAPLVPNKNSVSKLVAKCKEQIDGRVPLLAPCS
jgi:hypothetical protein